MARTARTVNQKHPEYQLIKRDQLIMSRASERKPNGTKIPINLSKNMFTYCAFTTTTYTYYTIHFTFVSAKGEEGTKKYRRYINNQHILANDAETLSIQSIKQHRQTVAPIIIIIFFLGGKTSFGMWICEQFIEPNINGRVEKLRARTTFFLEFFPFSVKKKNCYVITVYVILDAKCPSSGKTQRSVWMSKEYMSITRFIYKFWLCQINRVKSEVNRVCWIWKSEFGNRLEWMRLILTRFSKIRG